MDNLTHSLVGALVGEVAARFVPAVKSALPDKTRRMAFLSLMVVGSNLPDFDLLYTTFTDGKLGYLLHHRGHTHTVIGAVVGAVLMFAVTLAWLRRRRELPSINDRCWLAALALFAPLLHICMDAANSYGVHPFWPLNNDWMYGDSIFIVEPLFWATAAPLVFLLHSKLTRTLVALILIIGILLSFGTGMVPRPLAVGLSLLTITVLLITSRMSGRAASLTGLAAAASVFSMFVLAGHFAHRRVEALATTQFPNAVLLDTVLTPQPVNPLCWEAILVQLDQDNYTLRRAIFALAPAWLSATQCPVINLSGATTAIITPVTAASNDELQWHGEASMSRVQVQSVIQDNCAAAALSRFARALFIRQREQQWLVGDLRFDREPGLGMAELALDASAATCPQHVPPWTPPRSDVLGKP